MSTVSKVLRLTRQSIVSNQRAFIVRGDNFKEREEAFEAQFVKQKERDDLRKLAEQKKAQEKKEDAEKPSKQSSNDNSNAERIKEIQEKIAKLEKELKKLQK